MWCAVSQMPIFFPTALYHFTARRVLNIIAIPKYYFTLCTGTYTWTSQYLGLWCDQPVLRFMTCAIQLRQCTQIIYVNEQLTPVSTLVDWFYLDVPYIHVCININMYTTPRITLKVLKLKCWLYPAIHTNYSCSNCTKNFKLEIFKSI